MSNYNQRKPVEPRKAGTYPETSRNGSANKARNIVHVRTIQPTVGTARITDNSLRSCGFPRSCSHSRLFSMLGPRSTWKLQKWHGLSYSRDSARKLFDVFFPFGGNPIRGTTSHHPFFSMGLSKEKHPTMGAPPWPWKPHVATPSGSQCRMAPKSPQASAAASSHRSSSLRCPVASHESSGHVREDLHSAIYIYIYVSMYIYIYYIILYYIILYYIILYYIIYYIVLYTYYVHIWFNIHNRDYKSNVINTIKICIGFYTYKGIIITTTILLMGLLNSRAIILLGQEWDLIVDDDHPEYFG